MPANHTYYFLAMNMMIQPSVAITQRPICDEDHAFLLQLYMKVRWEELALTAWSQEQKVHFLSSQFSLQRKAYHDRFPNAQFELLLMDENPVGRLYVDRAKDILIIDLSIDPMFRNKGIGTYLLKNLIAEAKEQNCSISLHVERNNPAFHLYKRQGFQVSAENELYFYMQYKPLT